MVRTGVGRGRGRAGRSGRQTGRGRGQRGHKRPARRSISPPNDAPDAPSVSGTASGNPAKKKYRTFGEDNAKVRDTLIEKAARERVKTMKSNAKKPGKMPHGFGTKQIKQFANQR